MRGKPFLLSSCAVLAASLAAMSLADAAVFPRGGVAPAGTGDVAVPSVGSWIEWTKPSAGALIAQLPASGNDATGCNNYDGANPTSCGANGNGTVTLTGHIDNGSGSAGTTLTVTVNSGTIKCGDTIADPASVSGANVNVATATQVVSGCPLTGTGTVTVNTSQMVASETMYTNPPALSASAVTTTINNFGLSDVLNYSGAGMSGGCSMIWQPGGHAAAQALGVLRLCLSDVEAGSGSANWTLSQPPGMLQPITQGQPGWSLQTGSMDDFWTAPNSSGVYQPVVAHEYAFEAGIPNGPSGIILNGGASGGREGRDSAGAGFFYDLGNDFILGPVKLGNSCWPSVMSCDMTFNGLHQGYLPEFGGRQDGGATSAVGPDGKLYGTASNGSGLILGVLGGPLAGYKNSSKALGWDVVFGGSGCFPGFGSAVVIWDPGHAGQLLWAQYNMAVPGNCTYTASPTSTSGPTKLEIVYGMGGTPTYLDITLTGSVPAWVGSCDGINICNERMAYDPDDNTILITDGSTHLGAITLTWTGSTYAASIADLSSSAGTPPPATASTDCGSNSVAGLEYINRRGNHLVHMNYCGRDFAYNIRFACPAGSPSPDGSVIGAPTACTLKDSGGSIFAFDAAVTPARRDQKQSNYMLAENGSDTALSAYQLEIAQSGNLFLHQACGTLDAWLDSSGRRVPSPTGAAFINHALGTNPTQTFQTLRAAEVNGITNGQTITIQTQAGVDYWFDSASIGYDNGGTLITSGARIVGQSGAALYCTSSGNGGVLEQYSNAGVYGAMNTLFSDLELGWNHATTNNGPNSCFNNVAGAANPTLLRVVLSNCDMGFESDSGAGVVALTAVKIEHNGGDTGSGAPSHNVYLSGHDPTTSAVVNGGYSRCPYSAEADPMNLDTRGFIFKSRYAKLRVANYTAGEPSLMLYSGCNQQTVFDLSCGGDVHIGEPDGVITPASVTSSGTVATVTLPTATATAGTYNSTTGVVTLTVATTNFLPGTPIVITGATGTGSFAVINGEQVSTTGSGTTLTFTIQTGLTMTITGATVQYELPMQVGDQFVTTVSGAVQTGYNGKVVATAATLTTFTYTLGGAQTSPATGTITFTIPGGGVIEFGPDTEAGAQGMIRYTAEITNATNCPAGNAGYATNTLLVQNQTVFNDTGAFSPLKGYTIPLIFDYGHNISASLTMTAMNNNFIDPLSGCADGATSCAAELGAHVVDGGGNHFYTSRASAAAAGVLVGITPATSAYPVISPVA